MSEENRYFVQDGQVRVKCPNGEWCWLPADMVAALISAVYEKGRMSLAEAIDAAMNACGAKFTNFATSAEQM